MHIERYMQKKRPQDSKTEALKKDGVLNSHPETVSDELFQKNEFFDSKDLVQVKYEMLRRVTKDDFSISEATRRFGFSRPSFYQAQAALKNGGLSALVPRRRGPKGAHKLSEQIMGFVEQSLKSEETLTMKDIVLLIKDRFGLDVHPRSIERALERRKKKRSVR
jgi:transposase